MRFFVLFICVLAMLVGAASAQMPYMQIEDYWEIQDTHAESDAPLVTELWNGADRLGYDSASDTFYCTIGLTLGDEWPELTLRSEAQDVELFWLDDYAYDGAADAVAQGNAYEAVAVQNGRYHSFHIVFTGLPLIVLNSDREIAAEYVPGTFDLSAQGYEPIHSAVLTHLRAGGDLYEDPKLSYRVEFHRAGKNGEDKKQKVSLLGMPEDTDWLLLATFKDETCVRNLLAWQSWKAWNEGKEAIHSLEGRMVELFVQDRYMGLYTLMQRVNVKSTLKWLGGSVKKDPVYRTIHMANIEEKPVRKLGAQAPFCYLEAVRVPEETAEDRVFDDLRSFIQMTVTDPEAPEYLDDESFARIALNAFDLEEYFNYYMFLQLIGTDHDNVQNNLYIYTVKDEDGQICYHYALWDLDLSYKTVGFNNFLTIGNRLLTLNVGGAQEILWRIWDRQRSGAMSDEAIYDRICAVEDQIARSGAYLRESLNRRGASEQIDLREIRGNAEEQIQAVEAVLNEYWPRDAK